MLPLSFVPVNFSRKTFVDRGGMMLKKALAVFFLSAVAVTVASAQDKGVDTQTGRIRDTSSDRAPANNGVKQNTGTGRGIDFGAGRTPEVALLPNPFRFTARRDEVIKAVEEVMQERKLVLDTSVSKFDDGLLISQPYRFVKGVVVAQTALNQFAEVPVETTRGWSQGRYTLIVEVQAIDATSADVSVNARVEGRSDGAAGAEWITLRSNGGAEQEFLTALIEKLTSATPPGRTPTQP